MDSVKVNQATEHELNVAFKCRSGAFFFLREDDLRDLGGLVLAAGMDVRGERLLDPADPTSAIASGAWGPVFACARIAKYAYNRCLEVYFSQRELLELEEGKDGDEYPLEEDPYWPLATTFRRAAEEIRPEVGFVITGSLAASSEDVDRNLYDLILAFVPDTLMNAYPFNLLYFDAERTRRWTSRGGNHALTELDVREGRLFFERYRRVDLGRELDDAERELKRLLGSGGQADDDRRERR